MPDLQNQIEQIVAEAAARITALVQQAAVESISSTLGALAGSAGRGRAISRQSAGRRPTALITASAPAPGRAAHGKRGKGEKRPAGEIEATMKKVGDFIAKNPGLRIEQINQALGTTTKDLALPLRKLIANKVVKTQGEKRSTKYFPSKGRAKA